MTHPLFTDLAARLQAGGAVPMYRQITAAIEAAIARGALPPGERLPSERELTALLGVSRRTVRTALTRLIADGWLDAAHGRGHFVRETPRLLRFLVPDHFSPTLAGNRSLYYELLHRAAEASRCEIHYTYTPDVAAFRRTLETPPQGFDALLIYRPLQLWLETLPLPSPLPVLVVNRDTAPVHFVSADHAGQITAALARLHARGHRRIGYVGGEFAAEGGQAYLRRMFEGYEGGLRKHGLAPGGPPCLLPLGRPETWVETLRAFLSGRPFSALILSGGAFGAALEAAIAAEGIAVPESLSLIASIEPETLEELSLPWSACLYPNRAVARRSLEILSALCRGTLRGPVCEYLPAGFREGATIANPPRPR